jgi:hypothetical protein
MAEEQGPKSNDNPLAEVAKTIGSTLGTAANRASGMLRDMSPAPIGEKLATTFETARKALVKAASNTASKAKKSASPKKTTTRAQGAQKTAAKKHFSRTTVTKKAAKKRSAGKPAARKKTARPRSR